MTVVVAGRVCPPGAPGRGWIAFDGATIAETGSGGHEGATLDLGDTLLAPGFVDLQVNGVDDVDFAAADAAGWARAARRLLRDGTTAWCPTVVTAPLASYAAVLGRIGMARRMADLDSMVGVHLEGPFLGGAPGAHPVDLLRPADVAWLAATLDAHPGLVRVVTLAPEADPGLAATSLLARRGVAVALGHSTSSYDAARAAASAGATIVTHLFNGMGPLHQREPGLAGAALDDERLTPTLIADLVHVHPAMLRLAIARKRRVALVTDAVATAAGAVGGIAVEERGGAAYLPDGTLAGSTLTMLRAVQNVVGLGVPVERAVEMASAVPAEVLGLADRGRLVPGARADVVALDPERLEVRAVWLAGELVSGDVPSS